MFNTMSNPVRLSRTASLDRNEIIEEVTSEGEVKKYMKGRLLGKGGFAKCFELTCCETKKVFAGKAICKELLEKKGAKQKLMSEIKIHRSLDHSKVVGFRHFFEDAQNVFILLEICPNQTMNELLKRRRRLMEIEVQSYALQIIEALMYLHERQIIHRDLKLGNMFLSEKMEIKLGDFGLAAKVSFEGEKKKTICGTPNYIAPEILESRAGHSYEVDIWSFGVVLYTLSVGRPPFETSDVKTTYKRIKANSYSFPENVCLSPLLKDLISKILNLDPRKRPTLTEILNHEFLQGNIPKLLPVSTLACPPSSTYIKQFQGNCLNSSLSFGGLSNFTQKPSWNLAPVASNVPKCSLGLASTNGLSSLSPSLPIRSISIKKQPFCPSPFERAASPANFDAILSSEPLQSVKPSISESEIPSKFEKENTNPSQELAPSQMKKGEGTILKEILQTTANKEKEKEKEACPSVKSEEALGLKKTENKGENPICDLKDEGKKSQALKVDEEQLNALSHASNEKESPKNNLEVQKDSETTNQLEVNNAKKPPIPCKENESFEQNDKLSNAFAFGSSNIGLTNPVEDIGSLKQKELNRIQYHRRRGGPEDLPANPQRASSMGKISRRDKEKNERNSKENEGEKNGLERGFGENKSIDVVENEQPGKYEKNNENQKESGQESQNLFEKTGILKDRFKKVKDLFNESPEKQVFQCDKNPSGEKHQETENLNGQENKEETKFSSNKEEDIWVRKWVDFSAKYGLGYLLSDGTFGVYFNDSTKLVFPEKSDDSSSCQIEYIQKMKENHNVDQVSSYALSSYPKELYKKMMLFHHFKSYLFDSEGLQAVPVPPKDEKGPGSSASKSTTEDNWELRNSKLPKCSSVYVKKWMRTKYAILFRLSNKVVQVVFQDQTQIILSSELRVVTYVNKKEERISFDLATAMESKSHEMTKRLKYTKDILNSMSTRSAKAPN